MASKLVDFYVGLCFHFGVVGSLLLFISVHRLGVGGIAVAWAVMLSAASGLGLLLAVAVQRHDGIGAALQAYTLPVIGVLLNTFTLLVHAGSLLASPRLFFLA